MAEQADGSEKKAFEKVIIPTVVAEQLRQGSRETLNTIQEQNSDLVITILRSGTLAYSGVEAQAEQKDITLPPNIDILVPKSLSEKLIDEDKEFQLYSDADWEDFQSRLAEEAKHPESELAQRIEELKTSIEQLRNEGRIKDIKKVVIADDFAFGGATQITAEFIAKQVLGPDVAITQCLVFESLGGWVEEIRKANFNTSSHAENELLRELLKGVETGGINPDWGALRQIGAQVVERLPVAVSEQKNPADSLAEKYDLDLLLGLHERLAEALKNESVQ